MRRSLIAKIFGGYSLLICLLISTVLFFSFHTIREFYIDRTERDLQRLNMSLSFKIGPYLEQKRYDDLDKFVKDFGKKIDRRITIILPSGVVAADSDKDPKKMENHALRPEVVQALQADKGSSLRYSKTVESDMLYGARIIMQGGRVLAVSRISVYLKDIKDLLRTVNLNIFKAALLLLLLSLAVMVFFTNLLTEPINKLRSAARAVAGGNFKTRVFIDGNNEFHELAANFNEMIERLNDLFSQLTDQKAELNTVITSIQEALLVVNGGGKISMFNESFKKITGERDISGRYYWEVLREPVFIELMESMQKEQKNLQKEVVIRGRTYLLSGSVLPSGSKIVILLYDITEIKELEKMKKEFVINVSHELRTPLTAIKGFVETLEEETGEKHVRYIEIIKKHTDRLIHIVQDLLLFSGLEEKETMLHKEDIELKSVIDNVLRIFEQKAAAKNIKLDFAKDIEDIHIKADTFMLEQMFINLVDNAIKYTEKGAVKISLQRENKHVLIKISDTGIGIPKNELVRIFERFYVVDKSRSRKMGGTGLGLSIVKHIVLMHNGTIKVESEAGKGTTFLISLPA